MKKKIILAIFIATLVADAFGQSPKVKMNSKGWRLELLSKGDSLPVDVYRIASADTSFVIPLEIFSHITTDFESMVASDEMITKFFSKYNWWLIENDKDISAPIIFLGKKGDQYVARKFRSVIDDYGGFSQSVDPLSRKQAWSISERPLVIVPKCRK